MSTTAVAHLAGLGPQPLVDLPVAVGHEGQGEAFPLRGRRQSFVTDHRRCPHELLERRIGLGRFGDGDAGVVDRGQLLRGQQQLQ
jgi:hypothetical protein